ncbi:RNA polymerase II elongation factor ELL isoform X2 [Pieris napi]|uniref:RNA polymerase II elongation factor ELL isoform X2 n=1 Tax=Pieris napi TaxID=78633 RepID=UPI001FBA84B2|nr:RNA polymerase II elongation factor ELL isoform X2 [Pieris napi]
MAALPAGVQYALSSESSYKENKELVFVKLTDSALKAIEDFIRNNRDRFATPKIQFLPGNEGKISIPAPSSGNGSAGESTFHFNLNSNAEMEGPQGSFECVRNAVGGTKRLESCGPLPRRMRVQANDDSYEATKDRMSRTIAAEQSKCTRVIKPNQTDIGRRVKVRATHSMYSNGPVAERLERQERLERAERPDRPERAERPDRPERADRPERPERAERPERPERAEKPERPERPERADRLEKPERLERPAAVVPPTSRPQPQQQPQPHPNPQRPPSNPDLTRRPIKERLIQLLALKPFKKPELFTRLCCEGIKEKERSMVTKILTEITVAKDNCYHLRRHIWNDVNEDWPFYTEEEKRMLKRRKPQNLTPPLSSDSANSLSPRASPANKRSGAGAEEPPAAKKQRISHYRRPSPPSSGYATTSSGERHASDNEDDRTVKKDNGYTLNFTTVKDICPSPVKPNGFRNSPPVEQTSITVKDITNTEPLVENTALTSVPEENTTNDLVEIERQYPPITSSSTRRAYKNEFAALYTEYRALYARVAQVAALFTRLEQQLKRAEPKSPHHRSIEQRIVEEYQRARNDADYQKERRRVNYLHRKLNHIKRMVLQYDQLRNLKPERVSAASTTQAY